MALAAEPRLGAAQVVAALVRANSSLCYLPLLANLFLHYVSDEWMRRNHPGIPFERYADDVICHCRSLKEAQALKAALETRMAQCHLQLHPQKAPIVYCKTSNRQAAFPLCQFDFLGVPVSFSVSTVPSRSTVCRVSAGDQSHGGYCDSADGQTVATTLLAYR